MQARRVSGQVAPVPAGREPPRITGVIIDPVERDPEPAAAPPQLQVITEEVPGDMPASHDSIWNTVMRSVSLHPQSRALVYESASRVGFAVQPGSPVVSSPLEGVLPMGPLQLCTRLGH